MVAQDAREAPVERADPGDGRGAALSVGVEGPGVAVPVGDVDVGAGDVVDADEEGEAELGDADEDWVEVERAERGARVAVLARRRPYLEEAQARRELEPGDARAEAIIALMQQLLVFWYMHH